MGFELLNGDSDNDEGDSGEESPSSILKMLEESFPYYLSLGMTYDEYWNGDPTLVRAYREAEKIKQRKKNTEMWMQGSYVYDAMCCLVPSLQAFRPKPPLKYMNEPYALSEKEYKDRELRDMMRKQDEMREKFKAQMMAINAKNKKKSEEQNNG